MIHVKKNYNKEYSSFSLNQVSNVYIVCHSVLHILLYCLYFIFVLVCFYLCVFVFMCHHLLPCWRNK